MITKGQAIRAASIVARMGSIPLRETGTARPPFWSKCLCLTKCRPIPAMSGWIDYLTVQPGLRGQPSTYAAMVNRFVATGKDDPITSGLQYRFVRDGALMPAQEFGLTAGIELFVERSDPAPWPAQKRSLFIQVQPGGKLILQVNNTDRGIQRAYAGLFGWFYFTDNYPTEAAESTGFRQEDVARG